MMNLKEKGTFNLRDKEFVILESAEKEENGKTLYNYWLTIRNYGIIEYLIGVYDKLSFKDIKEYIFRYDLDLSYLNKWDEEED